MKMQDALDTIADKPLGFMVSFWHYDGRFVTSDHFPDVRAGEAPIATEEEAWELAKKFAEKTTGRCIQIHVIRRKDFKPVPGYSTKMIENR